MLSQLSLPLVQLIANYDSKKSVTLKSNPASNPTIYLQLVFVRSLTEAIGRGYFNSKSVQFSILVIFSTAK